MNKNTSSASVTLVMLVALCMFGAMPARADQFTVDWDVVPHHDQDINPGDSLHYDCSGSVYSARLCHSLWDGGLTLEAVLFSFYDDKWFDGYGIGEEESDVDSFGGVGVMRIRPECKPGLDPCFDAFTPLTMRIDGASNMGPDPNLFITSSRGGLVKVPSLSGLRSIDFSGDEWSDLDWLAYGFYLPAACEQNPFLDGCSPSTEKALILQDLTFDAQVVPEPAFVGLVVLGLVSAAGRRAVRGRHGLREI